MADALEKNHADIDQPIGKIKWVDWRGELADS